MSVGMALFTKASDAVFLYKLIVSSQSSTRIYVIRAKGCFASSRPMGLSGSGDRATVETSPQFVSDKAFWDECTAQNIKVTRHEERSKENPSIKIASSTNTAGALVNVVVNIGQMVVTPTVTQSELQIIIRHEALNDIALAARTQGHMDESKNFLERQRPTVVVAELKDVY